MSTIYKIVNFVNTTLASPITSTTATTAVLSSSANLPTLTGGAVFALILNDAATQQVYEILYVTAITGATCTVLRGQEGTAATTWLANDFAFGAATAAELSNFAQANVAGAIAIDTSSTAQTKTGALSVTGGITSSAGVAVGGALTTATTGSFSGLLTAQSIVTSAFSGGLGANGDIGVARSSTTAVIAFGSSAHTLDFGITLSNAFNFTHSVNSTFNITAGLGLGAENGTIYASVFGNAGPSVPTNVSTGDIYAQRSTGSGAMFLGGAAGAAVIDFNINNAGSVSVKTSTGTYLTMFTGIITQSSDASLKENVVPLTGALDLLKRLQPREFDWIGNKKHDLGFIAQEVEVVLPECVTTDWNGIKGYADRPLIAVLAAAFLEYVEAHP